MVRNALYVILLVVATVGTMLVVRHFRKPGAMTVIESQAMDMTTMTAPAGTVPVVTASAQEETFAPTLSYTGTVRAWSDEDVVARVAGRVVKVLAYPGDRVSARELLVELDSDELDARRTEAVAAVQMATAKTLSAQAGLRRAQAQAASADEEVKVAGLDISDSKAEERSARANREYWDAELERARKLYDGDALSLEELQKTRSQTIEARTEHHHKELGIAKATAKAAQARQAVRAQLASIGEAGAERTSAAASQAQQEAAQRTSEVMQGYTRIRAQSSATVTERLVSPGTVVMPGTVLLRLKQVDRLRLQARVPAPVASQIHVGTTIHYRAAAIVRAARVSSVFQEADANSRTVLVEAVVQDPSLVPGAYLEMRFHLSKPRDRLTIPLRAVQHDLEGHPFVWLLQDRGAQKQLWTCVMHPEIVREQPGKCPKCGMDLVAKEGGPVKVAAKTDYTCVMHPQVSRDRPGDCPICGMKLEPREKKGSLAVHRRDIEVAGESDLAVAVSQGLKAGDEVILEGASNLRDGTAVTRATRP